jgi:hypothetical protein
LAKRGTVLPVKLPGLVIFIFYTHLDFWCLLFALVSDKLDLLSTSCH